MTTKPGAIVPGTESCGCCDGIAASTPSGITNRMGLTAIAYRMEINEIVYALTH